MSYSVVVMNSRYVRCQATLRCVRLVYRFATVAALFAMLCLATLANAQEAPSAPSGAAPAQAASNESSTATPSAESSNVMKDFIALEQSNREKGELSTKEKHTIMFIMGVALLILLLATAYFGIAMAVMGKPLFIPHMLCAGLSVTLAIAHSVVAVVWFYPF